MAINFVNIGATANDGSGDPIRDAFDTVNDNFNFVNGGLFSGTNPSIISAFSVTAGWVFSNTYVNANSIVGNSISTTGNLTVGNILVNQNARILGNLIVDGTQTVTGGSQTIVNPIQNLHYSVTPLALDDGKDIGLEWQYYDSSEKRGFLGWQNTTEALVYMDNITDVANVITAGTYGNVKFGSLTLGNTTASTSNVTGALQVAGGVGVQGNIYIQSNLFIGNNANVGNLTVRGFHVGSLNFSGSDTIFINGSPVQTAATSFNGGTVGLATAFADSTQSTSVATGAVTITGGLGVAGNIWISNLHAVTGGNVRANVQGNVFTAAQPFITSLGTLTTLTMGGQINSRGIVPINNITHSLGSGGSNRFLALWVADINMSGVLTGGTVNSAGGTHTGNLVINTPTNSGLTTTQSTAYVFNENATTVRIGGGGIVEFNNNTQATSTTTGAVEIRGGMSVATGNLYIGGSGGNSIVAAGSMYVTQATAVVHSGNILPESNIVSNIGSITGWYSNVHAITFRGTSITARYADLAEIYKSDIDYSPGTVVVFGGAEEITVTEQFADHRVAGVISSNPAYLMNNGSPGLPVALRGRVPVKVINAVEKGDLLVTSHVPGYAASVKDDIGYGAKVFAKSLETNLNDGAKIIEAVIL
jgi:hypothetical protein